jgi:acetyl-CoA synthetase
MRMAETKSGSVEAVYMEKRTFSPSKEFVEKARLKTMDEYKKMHKRSLEDPNGFWGEMAEKHIDWFKKWTGPVEEYSFKDNIYLSYFKGGKLNITYNCLDRHLKTWRKNKAALVFQGEPLEEAKVYTYQQLHREVCKFANVLKKFGVKKGDRAIYLP